MIETRPSGQRAIRQRITHLEALEAESVFIMREVAAEFERPVLLFSGGKDSIVLLRLAEKAFRPAQASRSRSCTSTPATTSPRCSSSATAASRSWASGSSWPRSRSRSTRAASARSPATRRATGSRRRRCSTPSPSTSSTPSSAARAATRRRPAPRSASSRCGTSSASGSRAAQRPELWSLYNGRIRRGQHMRIFPICNWTEMDVWQYIEHEGIEVPSIYFAHERDVFRRDGMWLSTGPFLPTGPTSRSSAWSCATARSAT